MTTYDCEALLTFRIEKSRHTVFPVHDVEGEVYPLPYIPPLHLSPVQEVGPEIVKYLFFSFRNISRT